MSITDKLREYVIGADGMGMTHGHAKSIYAIADRIDAEAEDNERFRREAEPFCNRLREAAAERADVTLFGVDYVALPLDADGVPIRVGDMMEGEKVGGGFGEPFEVVGYILSNGELEPMDEHNCPRKRKYLRHHHAPTVEDVLREFAEKITDSQIPNVHPTYEEAIAEYAAKLRLAEKNEDACD